MNSCFRASFRAFAKDPSVAELILTSDCGRVAEIGISIISGEPAEPFSFPFRNQELG